MTFFYDLNKKLDSIREKPETTHKQLNERDMSRAAKGYEKYGKQGMEALAKAGRDGKALDPVRAKYDKYNNKEVDEGATGAAVGAGLGALAAGPLLAPLGGAAGAALGHYAEKGMDTEKTAKESMGDMAKKVGGMAKKVGGKVLDKLGHGSDADMIRDLQRKMGVAQTGKKPKTTDEGAIGGAIGAALGGIGGGMVGGAPGVLAGTALGGGIGGAMEEDEVSMTPKQKSFADKIAGAKKEVDERIGDVAAEAIKNALSPKQKKNIDMNKNGEVDANDFALLRKGGKKQVADEDSTDNAFTAHKRPRVDAPKVGTVDRGHKHDIEHTATGRKVTRRVDDQGYSVGADDAADTKPQKRGPGRPDGTGKKIGAKGPSGKSKLMTKEGGGMKQTFAILDDTLIDQIAAMNGAEVDPDAGSVETYDENTARQLIAFAQKNPQRLKRTQSINTAGMRPMAQRAGGTATGPEYGLKEEGSDLKAAMALLKKAGYKVSKSDSKPESNNDSAPKKKSSGSKPDFGDGDKKEPMKKAAKEKGSSEDKPKKVKEEGGTGTPTASSGFGFGKGIYDSLNRDLEAMIAESMSINMSDSTEGGKSLTITATDEDALKLGMLLKNAGLGGGGEEGSYMGGKTFCPTCGSGDCGCGDIEKEIDENAPDWPTDEEGTEDAMMYSGGLNGPKSTGQTTVPVIASQENRQHTYEAELQRMRDIAGIKEAKKPDFLDVDKDGDKKEPFKKAVDDKEEKKVEESIFALTNSWKAYKG